MHIIHIAAELTPIAKVGGLADVVLGLCRELSWKNQDVEIILPRYDNLDLRDVSSFEVFMHDLWSFFRGTWHHNTIWKGIVQGLPVYFVESHDPLHYFNRGKIYGDPDDIDRFAYFCRAALEFVLKRNLHPHILHIHDWPTSLVAPLYYDMYQSLGLKGSKVFLTIHNLEYQGRCQPRNLDDVGLPGDYYNQPERLQDNLYPKDLNALKGGIVYSDYVTTVSPNYAKEALTKENGRSLETTIALHQNKFQGILNGLDYSYWNPEIDSHLPVHFSSEDLDIQRHEHPLILKKGQLKQHLRHALSLNEEDCPLVCCITRLVSQKSPELIKHAIFRTLEKGGQFILLGSSADVKTQNEFLNLQTEFADNRNLHIELSFHEQLSHLVYAGSDIVIIPSLFEPCGLTQMIGMKYGTVPIVRSTGGLVDTVFDKDDSSYPVSERNGFRFTESTPKGLDSALDRALKCWFENPDQWRNLMENGMKRDFSWNNPCNEYLSLYKMLCSTKESNLQKIP